MRILISLGTIGFLCFNLPTYSSENKLIKVPTGTYLPLFSDDPSTKNSKNEEKKIQFFKIQKFPVSNKDFWSFVQKETRWQPTKINPIFSSSSYLKHWNSDGSFLPKISQSPVVYVSWFSADAYCRSKGMRLPTTNEWEYLASFPLLIQQYKLDSKSKNKLILEWYGEPSGNSPPEKMGKNRNTLGVYDLFGLIWEWTYDFNSALMTTDNRSNSDSKTGLFCGGGAVGSNSPEDYAAFMRYAFRSSLKGDYCGINLGFRCAQ